MNRRDAKRLVEAGTLTVGDLRKAIAAKRGKGGMSRVNPAFTLEQALDVMEASLERPDEAPAVVNDRLGHMLIARNIVRECM